MIVLLYPFVVATGTTLLAFASAFLVSFVCRDRLGAFDKSFGKLVAAIAATFAIGVISIGSLLFYDFGAFDGRSSPDDLRNSILSATFCTVFAGIVWLPVALGKWRNLLYQSRGASK